MSKLRRLWDWLCCNDPPRSKVVSLDRECKRRELAAANRRVDVSEVKWLTRELAGR